MLTVRDLAEKMVSPESVTVLLDNSVYELINFNTFKLDERLLDMVGDYVVADFAANAPDKYNIWVMNKPIKASDLK